MSDAADDLFGEDSRLIKAIEGSRHMRECATCRAKLVAFVRDSARRCRTEMEHDLGRPLTADEKSAVARALLTNASLTVAVIQMANSETAGANAGSHDGVKQAIEEIGRKTGFPFKTKTELPEA